MADSAHREQIRCAVLRVLGVGYEPFERAACAEMAWSETDATPARGS